MSDYYNKNYRRKKRSRSEKIGFYTALSICMIAICMAVYSTYNTLKTSDISVMSTQDSTAQQVNEAVTGVYETIAVPQIDITVPTATAEAETEPTEKADDKQSSKTALETMLSTDLELTYPLKSKNVVREYSEKSVYFKTLNVWKPHTGVDFAGELGDDVCSMCGGAVTNIYDDKMYGKTVEVSINNAVCIYSGLGTIDVNKGDSVEAGAKLGTIGTVPFEASDENHIHVQLKIDGKYADPLSFIGNND